MSKEGRLTRVGVLAPAALSACMDASVLAVPAASAIVSTVLKELSKAFMLKKWFHGSISAAEAEQLMMERGKHGSFLVRESRGRPGDYVLTVRVKRRVSHVVIRKQNDKYDVGTGEEFDDLIGLIEHFRKFPIVEASGEMLRLLQPFGGLCSRCCKSDEPDDVVKREEQAHLEEKKIELNREFKYVELFDKINYFTTIQAVKPENIEKNRYKNVLPYDQTRVILAKRYLSESDYINASYIRNPRMFADTFGFDTSMKDSMGSIRSLPEFSQHKDLPLVVSRSVPENMNFAVMRSDNIDWIDTKGKKKVYIAVQGCMHGTKSDFWRMVSQEDVNVIVMMTKEYESAKMKCARYWPLKNKREHYDGFRVTCTSEKIHEDYVVRELEIFDSLNFCRIIYQYQYLAWPDHGVPERITSILHFLEDVNECLYSMRPRRGRLDQVTLCVHCSAGVGRTGTFIALDMLIDKIKKSGVDTNLDISEVVKVIRKQRSGMVQNEEQYQFIYFALQEYIDKEKGAKKSRFLCYKN